MLDSVFLTVIFVGLTGQIVTGSISDTCLNCICEVESNCRPLGCHHDGYGDACGYFQIHYDYYTDCGKPRPRQRCSSARDCWRKCSREYECAADCVRSYMTRYENRRNCGSNCESHARLHNGGPNGCNNRNTDEYWRRVQSKGCNSNS